MRRRRRGRELRGDLRECRQRRRCGRQRRGRHGGCGNRSRRRGTERERRLVERDQRAACASAAVLSPSTTDLRILDVSDVSSMVEIGRANLAGCDPRGLDLLKDGHLLVRCKEPRSGHWAQSRRWRPHLPRRVEQLSRPRRRGSHGARAPPLSHVPPATVRGDGSVALCPGCIVHCSMNRSSDRPLDASSARRSRRGPKGIAHPRAGRLPPPRRGGRPLRS
jgi:hypothetical protein